LDEGASRISKGAAKSISGCTGRGKNSRQKQGDKCGAHEDEGKMTRKGYGVKRCTWGRTQEKARRKEEGKKQPAAITGK